jgi:riboflavin kinase / FMN adenylyltransferase
MRVISSLSELTALESPTACALGIFDGVHVGHQMVLEAALRRAKSDGLQSVVFTFANHPQSVLSKTPTELLTTLDERLELFEAMGFDAVLAPPFDETIRACSAAEFVSKWLVEGLHARYVSVGYDHRFGKGRQGDGEFLKASGRAAGFAVDIIDPVRVGEQIVSSTLIRKLLTYGDVQQAETLLGRPYTIRGRVIQGAQRGRQLGFPTANFEEDAHRLLPANGVYAGIVTRLASGEKYWGVCNVGVAPTMKTDGEPHRQLEAHLLDFDGDLYGERLEFAFYAHLRSEMTFPTVDALIAQIREDCATSASLLALKH